MAFKSFSKYEPDKDAGWGLIYRLNNLWAKVDDKAEKGDLDGWNFTLDRIFCNLLYTEEMDIIKDNNGEIKEIKLNDKDRIIFEWFGKKIKKLKQDLKDALKKEDKIVGKKEYSVAKQEHYLTLMKKDIWLRKYMKKLGLYLKTVDKNDPSRAMWQ